MGTEKRERQKANREQKLAAAKKQEMQEGLRKRVIYGIVIAVLVFGGPTQRRNGDSDHRYRPDSDVYWLTGWEQPEVAAFLRPGEEPLVMFVQPRDRARETWEGRRPGPDGAREQFGADVAYPMHELEAQLPRLLQGVDRLHYAFAGDPDQDAVVMASVNRAAKARLVTELPELSKTRRRGSPVWGSTPPG